MNGKGSKPRPFSVKLEEFGRNHDRIFGPKKPQQEEQVEKKQQPND